MKIGLVSRNFKFPKFYAMKKSFLYGGITFLLVVGITSSIVIAGAFALLMGVITYLTTTRRNNKIENLIVQSWPEVIDHLMSGIQSGLSLSESLAGLSERGPEVLKPYFGKFKEDLLKHGDFNKSVEELREIFAQHASDQIFEALLISRTLGGAELLNIFRTVGDFLRQDLALRREIEVKHGWIKNSAHLSAIAPWLLLLLLSTQQSTARAFSTLGGAAILGSGIVMTLLAYLWMAKLSHLPETPRVFANVNEWVKADE